MRGFRVKNPRIPDFLSCALRNPIYSYVRQEGCKAAMKRFRAERDNGAHRISLQLTFTGWSIQGPLVSSGLRTLRRPFSGWIRGVLRLPIS
jgi:hypothetical protein